MYCKYFILFSYICVLFLHLIFIILLFMFYYIFYISCNFLYVCILVSYQHNHCLVFKAACTGIEISASRCHGGSAAHWPFSIIGVLSACTGIEISASRCHGGTAVHWPFSIVGVLSACTGIEISVSRCHGGTAVHWPFSIVGVLSACHWDRDQCVMMSRWHCCALAILHCWCPISMSLG